MNIYLYAKVLCLYAFLLVHLFVLRFKEFLPYPFPITMKHN